MDGVCTTERARRVAGRARPGFGLAIAATVTATAVAFALPTPALADNHDEPLGEIVVEPPVPGPPAPSPDDVAQLPPGGPSTGLIPALSSRPNSTNTIYLDFDGHAVSFGPWVTYNHDTPIVAAPFDLDGDPNVLSVSEQAAIRKIWDQVAEDFAPFDVNVTTVDPGVERLVTGITRATGSGTRIVVTSTTWASSGAGLAVVGSFGRGQLSDGLWIDTPGWIFSERLLRNADFVATASSHEAGHAMGLRHDGADPKPAWCTSAAYYCGHTHPHGTWAPIMGTGYDRPTTQWSRGEYPGATNLEDDVAIIERALGFVPDDHGDTPDTATPLAAPSTILGLAGFGDVDAFTLATGDAPVRVTLTPASSSVEVPNLRAALVVTDAAGNEIGRADPDLPAGWTASLELSGAGAQHHFQIVPVGLGTPATGYSAYASAGAYRLTVAGTSSAPPVSSPAPDSASGLTTIAPQRLLDTRTTGSRLAPGGRARVEVAARLGVDATAAVLNVTAVDPSAAGYLSVVGCSAPPATTSSVNHAAWQTVSNSTIATLDADGAVCVESYAESDVVVDVTGWLGPDAEGSLVTTAPARLADTRQSGRLAAGDVLQVTLPGDAPDGVTGAFLNVTAVGPVAAGYLTVYPCAAGRPDTSSLNYAPGDVRPNTAIVDAPDRRVCVFTHAATDVLVDLTGYVAPGGLRYQPATPTRLVDTRTVGGKLAPGAVRRVAVGGPSEAAATSLNVTAVDHQRPGYTTVYDCGSHRYARWA